MRWASPLARAWLLPAFGAGESGPRLRQAPALDTANARVIVKYRDGSNLMRVQSATTPAASSSTWILREPGIGAVTDSERVWACCCSGLSCAFTGILGQ